MLVGMDPTGAGSTPVAVTLRPAVPDDIDLYYRLQQDPVAVWMAAFTSVELTDREVFWSRWRRILSDPTILVRTVLADGQPIGQVLKHEVDGEPEVSYWIAREHWGRGHATEALRLLLAEFTDRPVSARVAQDNDGSLAVLRHNGFVVTGEDAAPAAARGEVVGEYVLTLAH